MRTIVIAAGLLVLAQAPAHAEVVAREGKGYLEKREDGQRVLHLKGSPYEMGFQHGKLLGGQAAENMKRIADNQGEMGKSPEYMAYLMMRPMMHDLLRPHVPKRFAEEMRGLADACGVDYSVVEAGNLFPAAFHCSGIALKGKATRDGSLYHVRILDYMTRLGLQESAIVIIHEPEGHNRWMNVGFAGFVGSVTGMNAKQVAIGEMGGRGLLFWDGVPMAFLIRDALERADTQEQALEIFKTSKRTCEYYYVISDGKTRDAVGIWATPEVFQTIAPGQSYALFEKLRTEKGGAADGKSFAKGLSVDAGKYRVMFKGENGAQGFIALQPEDTLVLSGEDRYLAFVERLMPRYGQVDAEVLQELVKRPVSMKSNLHVAIFHPETLEAWVAVAAKDGSPACSQPYYKFSLAPEAVESSK